MSPITTHVLDTAKGCPAKNIPITLDFYENNATTKSEWVTLALGSTDHDGRLKNMISKENFVKGTYRLTFDTQKYHGGHVFFPSISVVFEVKNTEEHYHVPILLSPFGYSTYRGS